MKKALSYFLLLSSFFIVGCKQYPIFYTISQEVAPKKPKVPGAPSKILRAGSSLYVSNGSLWTASADSNWSWQQLKPNPSGGSIRDIALGGSEIYALTVNDKNSSTSIWKRNSDGSWTSVSSGGGLWYQALFGVGGKVYASVYNGTTTSGGRDYSLVDVIGGAPVEQNIHPVSAVASSGGKVYIATLGGGIIIPGETTLASDKKITGLLDLGSALAAVASDGTLYQISGGAVSRSVTFGISFTGAMTVSKNSSNEQLLLLGIRAGTLQFGYREMRMSGGSLDFTLRYPGESTPSSVGGNKNTYVATLESRALSSIMQAPGTESWESPLMFASTQKDGLWSYRYDGNEGKHVWNYEP